tara:strand:- start:300 stop:539 length:240 start_codon:yes stop_codon:yes gene_type:complete
MRLRSHEETQNSQYDAGGEIMGSVTGFLVAWFGISVLLAGACHLLTLNCYWGEIFIVPFKLMIWAVKAIGALLSIVVLK